MASELARLLEIWARTRDPRAADAIDLVTPALPDDHGPEKVGAGTTQAHEDAWLVREAAKLPDDAPELLWTAAHYFHQEHVHRTALPARRAVARLKAITARVDPRVAAALVELVARPPQRGPAGRPVMRVVLAGLGELRDVRHIDRLEELARGYLAIVSGAFGVSLQRQLGRLVERLRAVAPVPLTKSELAACAAVEARFPHRPSRSAAAEASRRGADLLRQIHEHPEDDAARLVYADWLAERGDPHGEFIALQLATERQPQRELQLRIANDRTWVGNLAAATYDWKFRRGFLSECVVGLGDKKAIAAVAGDPAWSTVEEVTLFGELSARDAARLLGAPSMKSLRRVHGVAPAVFVDVFGGQPGRLTAATFTGHPDERELVVVARHGLASIGFDVRPRAKYEGEEDAYPEDLPLAFAQPWSELVIRGNLSLERWIAAAQSSPVERYVHHTQELELHFTRDDERGFSQLRVVPTYTSSLQRLGYALRTIASERLRSLDLSELPFDADELRPIASYFRRAACRWPG